MSFDRTPLFAHLISSPLVQESGPKLTVLELLKYQQERDLLRQTVKNSGCSVHWRSEIATYDTFMKNATECRVLHLTGHTLSGSICVESEHGEMKPIAQVSELFRIEQGLDEMEGDTVSGRPSLVFVSACSCDGASGSEDCAKAFVEAGVPHAIGVKRASKESKVVFEQANLLFISTFYQAILGGTHVDEAFYSSKQRIEMDSTLRAEAEKFLLLPLPGENGVPDDHHSVNIFPEEGAVGGFSDITVPSCENPCPANSSQFLGRSYQLYEIYCHLFNRARLVSITGPPQIGKSQVCFAAAAYACERNMFDRIVYCNVKSLGTGVPFQSKIADKFGVCKHHRGAELMDALFKECEPPEELTGRRVWRGRVILVLDDCDQLCTNGTIPAAEFSHFLVEVLDRIPALCIMLTSEEQAIPADNPSVGMSALNLKVVRVPPLPEKDAIKLFRNLMPREMAEHEKTIELEPMYKFAFNSIIMKLEGHPGLICSLMKDLIKNPQMNLVAGESRIVQLIDTNRERLVAARSPRRGGSQENLPDNARHLRPQPLQPPSRTELLRIWREIANQEADGQLPSETSANENTILEWTQVRRYIQKHFREYGPGVEQRPLDDSDFLFLASSGTIWRSGNEDLAPIRNANKVYFKGFTNFWPWFQAQVTCLVKCGSLWPIQDPTVILRAFMNRVDATSLLRGKQTGTFLVRLTESESNSLAISYVEQPGRVNHVKITVDENTNSFKANFEGQCRRFRNLKELITHCNLLVQFCGNPDVPKEQAFTLV